jgi:hypothetical protein
MFVFRATASKRCHEHTVGQGERADLQGLEELLHGSHSSS